MFIVIGYFIVLKQRKISNILNIRYGLVNGQGNYNGKGLIIVRALCTHKFE